MCIICHILVPAWSSLSAWPDVGSFTYNTYHLSCLSTRDHVRFQLHKLICISSPKFTESAPMPLLQGTHTIAFIKPLVPITPSQMFLSQCLLAKHCKWEQLILDGRQVKPKLVITSLHILNIATNHTSFASENPHNNAAEPRMG